MSENDDWMACGEALALARKLHGTASIPPHRGHPAHRTLFYMVLEGLIRTNMIGTGWKTSRHSGSKNGIVDYENFLRRLIFEAEKNPSARRLNFDTVHHYNMNMYDIYTGTFSFLGEYFHQEYRVMGVNISKSDICANFPALKTVAPAMQVKLPAANTSKSVASTALAERDCAQWLSQEFSERSALTKKGFLAIACTKFKGRLSERGFQRAWDLAVLKFPDRRLPGRKSKQRIDTPV